MYKPTIWQDHVEGIQEGTDMNAANFNNIEAGIMETAALTALNASFSRYGYDVAKNAEAVYFSAVLKGGIDNDVLIPVEHKRNNAGYSVLYERSALLGNDNDVGDIIISTKYQDYFKVRFSGSADTALIVFVISGGMI